MFCLATGDVGTEDLGTWELGNLETWEPGNLGKSKVFFPTHSLPTANCQEKRCRSAISRWRSGDIATESGDGGWMESFEFRVSSFGGRDLHACMHACMEEIGGHRRAMKM